MRNIRHLATFITFVLGMIPPAEAALCEARSGPTRNPVIELYTSEGCSSCPPADRWLSTFRSLPTGDALQPVVMAFHVSYWDYIGWIDRFAQPAFNERQRELARRESRKSVYTPQVVRDGMDWPRWFSQNAKDINTPKANAEPAGATIQLRRTDSGTVEAAVTPVSPTRQWSAFWTVTEDGHASKVRAGENRGETLRHDFVVRHLEMTPPQQGPARISMKVPSATAGHAQRVNLVVMDAANQKPLQALSLGCEYSR
ncbi:MAG: DUF1223 domain-containing protein [Betaproteobacteria bacterium]|nr:DUF1223 domain-containing protein [Betaproteobacteria bacterium]